MGKKLLVAYDEVPPNAGQGDFLAVVRVRGRPSFWGLRSKQFVHTGRMVFIGKDIEDKDLFAKLGFLLMKRHVKKVFKRMDYAEYGGAHLLGLNGVCIIGHGRSNATAVKNAIRQGREFVRGALQERIRTEILRLENVLRGANTP